MAIRGRKQRVTLVTTLLDPVAYPAEKLIALYARRWNLELALRHLKTTMGMEALRCLSLEMVEKELLAYLGADNLVRCLMAEAVAVAGVEMERLSFKGTVDAVRQYTAAIAGARNQRKRQQLWEGLVTNLRPGFGAPAPGAKGTPRGQAPPQALSAVEQTPPSVQRNPTSQSLSQSSNTQPKNGCSRAVPLRSTGAAGRERHHFLSCDAATQPLSRAS